MVLISVMSSISTPYSVLNYHHLPLIPALPNHSPQNYRMDLIQSNSEEVLPGNDVVLVVVRENIAGKILKTILKRIQIGHVKVRLI